MMIREKEILVCIVVEEGLKLFNSDFVRVNVNELIFVLNFYFFVYDEKSLKFVTISVELFS